MLSIAKGWDFHMQIKTINRGQGYDIYEVIGDLVEITLEEIANKCDANNFGYKPITIIPNKVVIKIYTD
jgi:hypothetical protein